MTTQRRAALLAPKGHCRGCGQPVPKGRFTWCSDACVKRALIKIDPNVARSQVHQRDKGVCATCGFDADQAGRVLSFLQSRRYDYRDSTYAEAAIFLANLWAPTKRPRSGLYYTPHLWEADHIVPVVEGGGGCELDNYRTLCVPCHKAETSALARRRALTRHEAKRPLLGVAAV